MFTNDPRKRTEPLSVRIRVRDQDLIRINYLSEKLQVEPRHIIEQALEEWLDKIDWANANRLGMTDEERRRTPKFRKRKEPPNLTERVQNKTRSNGNSLDL